MPLQFQGTVIKGIVATNTQGFGNALYRASLGNFSDARANSSTTRPCVALAIDTVLGPDVRLLLRGKMYNPNWTWTPGGELFLSEITDGLITQTEPTSGGVQKLGWAIDATQIFFDPDLTILIVGG